MKRIINIIIWSLVAISLSAQKSEIINTRLSLSATTDSLIVKYDLTGKYPAFHVNLLVTDTLGQNIFLKNVTGDIGDNIIPGTDKTIIWDMVADKAEVYGSKLFVSVSGNIFIPHLAKKKIWIPWLYIAAGASAATGLYAHMRSNTLYQNYTSSSNTDEAEKLHTDILRLETIRDVAFCASGALGIAGVVVHIRHNQKMKEIALSYFPLTEGAAFGLTCNF